jgi:chaperone modulatory protein CbpM
MTITEPEFLERARLDHKTLAIEEEWLIPSRTESELIFTEMDLARANLIRDLKQNMGVNDEGLSVILHILDQMHGLRRALAHLLQSRRDGSAFCNDWRRRHADDRFSSWVGI